MHFLKVIRAVCASMSLMVAASPLALCQSGNSKVYSDSVMVAYLAKRSHTLENVEVLATRLTVQNIIDSVIARSAINYARPVAYSLQVDIALRKGDTTLFKSKVEAYLARKLEKMRMYLMMVPEEHAYTTSMNALDKAESFRILEVTGYPKQLIGDYLADTKRSLTKNSSYFIRQPGEGDSAFVIITKHKDIPHSVFARRDISPQYPDACSFEIITINRRDWALTNSYVMITEVTSTERAKFLSASSYYELADLIRPLLADTSRKHFSSITRHKKRGSQYQVDDMLLENSLYQASRNLLKRASSETLLYYYWMHSFIAQDRYPDHVKLFSVGELLKGE